MVAPVSGRVVPLADVPDPVFAQEIVGPGLAIEPLVPTAPGELHTSLVDDVDGVVVAPVAGTVASLFPHAFAIETADGRTVLVHLGIDTVTLKGAGFGALVAAGDQVVVGQHMLTWDPAAVAAGGLATVCPVIALQEDPGQVELLVGAGTLVRRGDPLLRWLAPR
ncbi:PTS system N-acetylglucosamine-specific IIA component, Glc family [Sanguibacter gelidistatuariae]|uniref:PTS system N-acetylglucosamine-specific IIA component, Glc family n=2 Tax=Sanguibacter gelidistatuariae TaxID=1814289 RepID=A0A1G6N8M8_9MICO|nr:PTS system N-acetylglucosamine-specific IIA component, Glc family [Sanguibacter gelidistatuariae]